MGGYRKMLGRFNLARSKMYSLLTLKTEKVTLSQMGVASQLDGSSSARRGGVRNISMDYRHVTRRPIVG